MQKNGLRILLTDKGIDDIECTVYFALFKPGGWSKPFIALSDGRNAEKRR